MCMSETQVLPNITLENITLKLENENTFYIIQLRGTHKITLCINLLIYCNLSDAVIADEKEKTISYAITSDMTL